MAGMTRKVTFTPVSLGLCNDPADAFFTDLPYQPHTKQIPCHNRDFPLIEGSWQTGHSSIIPNQELGLTGVALQGFIVLLILDWHDLAFESGF
jgi:hypothetical protein